MEEGRKKGGREEGRRKERVIQCVWCMGGKVKEILGCSKVYSCTRKTCKSTVKKVS